MLDFFLQDSADIEEDITVLYPLVAALSEGQRTGLDFISLRELLCVALSVNYGEGDKEINAAESASIYEGVDRGIYEKGGVALTSDALRADAVAKIQEDSGNPQQLSRCRGSIGRCAL